jgi:hypothetical protein
MHESACGRFCCKSLFALVIKNSPGRRRDFRVSVWGTSSPDEKLTRDLARVIEAISIEGRASDCLTAGKLAPGNLGLLQQYRHVVCVPPRLTYDRSQMSSGLERGHSFWAVHDPQETLRAERESAAIPPSRRKDPRLAAWYLSRRSHGRGTHAEHYQTAGIDSCARRCGSRGAARGARAAADVAGDRVPQQRIA